MKVGLLLCDRVNEKYIEEFGDYPEMYARLFPHLQFNCYTVHEDVFPSSVEDYDVYMVTGSRYSVYEEMIWIDKVKSFIREIYKANKYFLGFCFGHQLLAESLGGKVRKASVGWCVGVHTFQVLEKKSWMKPFQNELNFLMMCQDQVVELPPNSQRLLSNKDCPNAMIQVGERMLSIQAHPEFTKAFDRILMESRVDKIGEEKVTQAINSLDKEIHTDVFRNWVNAILRIEKM